MAPLIATAGLNILLFLGTVRQPRNADRVLKFVKPLLEERNITLTILGIIPLLLLITIILLSSTSTEIILDQSWLQQKSF